MAYRSQAERGYLDENVDTSRPEFREPGTRRRKIAGYLRAANELRQTYVQSWNRPEGQHDGQDPDFTNVAMVSTGEEQMLLFPSYATRHIKRKPEAIPGTIQEVPGTGRDYRDTVGAGDAEFWKKQWEQYEDDKAIVDVDVRGWVFTPHKGQMTRKQRLMVALARQLVGIPAPTRSSPTSSAANSRPSSPSKKKEEELALQEAQAIIKKGEQEAEIAGKGGFSERPSEVSDTASIYGDQLAPELPARRQNGSLSGPSGTAGSQYGSAQMPGAERPPTQISMSQAELTVANANLMARLKPFMANPLTSTTINAFFYNETMSRQKTVTTDSYGHFNFRASLDFIPTHVRVLASEDLSVSEEVKIVESKGVSLISDVDDTVRHSAVTKGAREIFRNAFIRDLGELTIDGVKAWYNKLADMGVQVHYVSNSPWQLFPVLTKFCSIAGLPQGSFHLKQYSGMLQGIFEPVAERKKATLEKILRDFPERKFILVGDSGEADLEVYTDVVLENPGRVLGVFIRDVTTPPSKGFFDTAGPVSGNTTPKGRHSRNHSVDSLSQAKRFSRPVDIQNDDEDFKAAVAASLRDMEEETARKRRSVFNDGPSPTLAPSRSPERRPPLPKRPSQMTTSSQSVESDSDLGDLIDLRDQDETPKVSQGEFARPQPTIPAKPSGLNSTSSTTTPRKPPPPSKPARLRSPSNTVETLSSVSGETGLKVAPPRPRKPSTSVRPTSPSPLSQVHDTSSSNMGRPVAQDRQSYRGYAMQKLNAAYNALPSASTYYNNGSHPDTYHGLTTSPSTLSLASQTSMSPADARSLHSSSRAPPPPPQRRNQNTAQSAASAASRLSGYWSGQDSADEAGQPLNKREELWKRRWRTAKEVMDRDEVMLRTWRVGADVMDECVAAVKAEQEQMQAGRGQSRARWQR